MSDSEGDEDLTQADEKEGWFVDQTINISFPADIGEDELTASLVANRARLESLKYKYWQAKREKASDDRENRMYRNEMSRVVTAIEAIKDKLALKGCDFELSEWDREHPEAAYRRFARSQRTAAEEAARQREQERIASMDPISRFFHHLFN